MTIQRKSTVALFLCIAATSASASITIDYMLGRLLSDVSAGALYSTEVSTPVGTNYTELKQVLSSGGTPFSSAQANVTSSLVASGGFGGNPNITLDWKTIAHADISRQTQYAFAHAAAGLTVGFTVVGTESIFASLFEGAIGGVGVRGSMGGGGNINLSPSQGTTGGLNVGTGVYTATFVGPDAYVLCNETNCAAGKTDSLFSSVTFTNATFAVGATASLPILPSNGTTPGGAFEFTNVSRGAWYDPVVATGYDFQTTDGSKFTKILGFPMGFSKPFEVTAEGQVVGSFDSTNTVNFEILLGHGVAAFSIRNIDPGVDPDSPTAFPIALDFDQPTASFTMNPVLAAVPEPSEAALLMAGIVVLAAATSRRR